jgi:hypothetical protein
VTAVLSYLAAACDQQDRLGELMRADPAAGQATWPLRGELISQPDRLGRELGEGKPERSPRRLRRSWRRLRPARLRPPRRLRWCLPACAGVPQPASHGWVARAWRTPQVLRES